MTTEWQHDLWLFGKRDGFCAIADLNICQKLMIAVVLMAPVFHFFHFLLGPRVYVSHYIAPLHTSHHKDKQISAFIWKHSFVVRSLWMISAFIVKLAQSESTVKLN